MKKIIKIMLALFIMSGCEDTFSYTLDDLEKAVFNAMKASDINGAERLFTLYVSEFKRISKKREGESALKILDLCAETPVSQVSPVNNRILEYAKERVLIESIKKELSE